MEITKWRTPWIVSTSLELWVFKQKRLMPPEPMPTDFLVTNVELDFSDPYRVSVSLRTGKSDDPFLCANTPTDGPMSLHTPLLIPAGTQLEVVFKRCFLIGGLIRAFFSHSRVLVVFALGGFRHLTESEAEKWPEPEPTPIEWEDESYGEE